MQPAPPYRAAAVGVPPAVRGVCPEGAVNFSIHIAGFSMRIGKPVTPRGRGGGLFAHARSGAGLGARPACAGLFLCVLVDGREDLILLDLCSRGGGAPTIWHKNLERIGPDETHTKL